MKNAFFVLMFLIGFRLSAQEKPDLSRDVKIHLFLDPESDIVSDPDKHMAYGLYVSPPWPDGGSIFINLPEHLEYMPGTKGIARHHDKRNNVWNVSNNGSAANYSVESLTEPGIFFSMKATTAKDRVYFEMTITNRSKIYLKSIRPLLCFQYHHLKGFPVKLTNNFAHTFVVIDGKAVALNDLEVKKTEAVARMAQVGDCKDEHNWWAEEMGGMIEKRIDKGLTMLTSLSDDRKVIVSWSPGKNMLANSFIPCIHADPCVGDLAIGESRTVKGQMIFTRASLASIVNGLSE